MTQIDPSMIRRVVVLLMFSLSATNVVVQATPTALEWTTGETRQSVGLRVPGQAPCTYATAPTAVVQAARKVLGGDPANWWVDRDLGYVPRWGWTGEKYAVANFTHNKRHFVCWIQRDCWKRLDTPESLPYINEILGAALELPRDQHKADWMDGYINSVIYLNRGVGGESLYKTSWQEVKGHTAVGNDKPDKDVAAYRSLCVDPVVTRERDTWTIAANVLTAVGSVERWTLTIKSGRRTELTKVDVRQLHPPGTFYWDHY